MAVECDDVLLERGMEVLECTAAISAPDIGMHMRLC